MKASPRNLSGRSPRAIGFTLVELLVVIAIVSLLAALLLPSLARAKASACRVQCVSRVRQIGVALHLYLDDFRKFPAFDDDPLGGNTAEDRRRFWDHKLLPYAGTTRTFACPANPVAATRANSIFDRNWLWPDPFGHIMPNRSFGYNGSGTAEDPYPFDFRGGEPFLGLGLQCKPYCLPEGRVLVPSEMIAVADYDPLATDEDHDDDNHPDMLFLGLKGFHAQGANVLFCDGHAQYGKTNHWTALRADVRRQWNHDHEPHFPR